MASSETEKSSKEGKETKEAKTPPPSQEQPSATSTGTPEWTGFQAYSPIPPHGFMASSPQAHHYMWGVQHIMPPYGTPPHPYVAMYPHGGIYAHPSMASGSYPYSPFPMPSPNGIAEASVNSTGNMEAQGKPSEAKEKLPIKRSKGSLGSLNVIKGKTKEPGKTSGASANGVYSKSAESASEGSSEGTEANSENRQDSGLNPNIWYRSHVLLPVVRIVLTGFFFLRTISKLSMKMEPGYTALSIFYQWMSSRCGCILDSQPRQGKHMTVQDYYDQFLCWKNKLESVNYINNEEWYVDDFVSGLKIDLMVRVSRHKWIRRLSDAFRRAKIEEIFLSWEENPVVIDDEEFEDEFQGDEDVCDKKSDDLEVQLEIEPGKIVSPNADHKVFDELSQSNFIATTAYTMIDEELDVHGMLNSQNRATFDQILGNLEDEALKMLNKSIGLVLTGLNSFPEKLIQAKFLLLVIAAYQVFDKMPQVSFVWPIEELTGNKGFIPLIDCVPEVFDPGDGVETVSLFVWRFDEMSKTFSMSLCQPAFPFFDKMPSEISLERTRGNNGEVIMTVFDPGGITSHDAFKFNKYSIFPNVGKTDSEGFVIHTTAHTSYSSQHDNDIMCEWEAISSNSQFQLVSLSEVAWTNCWDYLQHCVGVYLIKLSTILMMVMLRIDFSYNHCCKRMWHEKICRSLIYIDHCLLIAVNNLIWRSFDDGTKPTDWPLQELLDQQKAVGYFPWSYDKQTQGKFSEPCQNSLRSVAFALGNGKHQGQSVDEYPLSTHVYKIAKNGDSDITAAFRLGMEKGSLELYVTVKGNFCVWMFTGPFHSPEARFPGGHKNDVLLMVIILESFVWDPGLVHFFSRSHAQLVQILVGILYILGDKDDFKRGGKRMICMWTDDNIQRGRHYDGMQESMQREYGIMELSRSESSDKDSHCQLETRLKEELIDSALRPRKLSPSHPIVIADFCKEAEDM